VRLPFETVRVLSVLSKSHWFNVSTSVACGPAPRGYVLVVTARMHEPNVLVPAAVPSGEDSVSRTLKMRGGTISQANRYLGSFCSSQRIFPPQIIQVLLVKVLALFVNVSVVALLAKAG
jgi:hypothetical protein